MRLDGRMIFAEAPDDASVYVFSTEAVSRRVHARWEEDQAAAEAAHVENLRSLGSPAYGLGIEVSLRPLDGEAPTAVMAVCPIDGRTLCASVAIPAHCRETGEPTAECPGESTAALRRLAALEAEYRDGAAKYAAEVEAGDNPDLHPDWWERVGGRAIQEEIRLLEETLTWPERVEDLVGVSYADLPRLPTEALLEGQILASDPESGERLVTVGYPDVDEDGAETFRAFGIVRPEWEILVELVPATHSGPVWQGILDEGMLCTGRPSGRYVQVVSEGDPDRYHRETGWYRRYSLAVTRENLEAAVRGAAWDDEADPLACATGPLHGALVAAGLVEGLARFAG